MKRPLGFTLLCVVLGLLSFAAFGNAYIQFTEGPIFGVLFAVLTLLYGVSSLVALIGLWKLKNWGYGAFLAWAIVVMLMAITTTPRTVDEMFWGHIALWLFIGALLLLLARYVRKVLLRSNNAFESGPPSAAAQRER
jgi:peptidoglycan/LPS O-acetylase OafA/YrhL